MQVQGVIVPSTSQWASPMVIVPKKDGSVRVCVDFRKTNQLAHLDAYPMPRIDEILDRLGSATYFSVVNLTRRYWQVPMSSSSQSLTAFSSPVGLFEFTVMPFGLNSAPATFKCLMNTVLSGCEQFLAAYLDDIVVFTASWDEHLKSLQTLFDRLQSAGLTAWPSKCQLGGCSTKYLGHIISNAPVQPDPDKLTAVASFPQPRTKKEVRSLPGLAGYYRRFIPAFSSLAKPLSDLTKKDASATPQWNNSCLAAFDRLKSLLCSKPVLMSADFDQPFVLEMDASGIGIGAVLSQDDAVTDTSLHTTHGNCCRRRLGTRRWRKKL